MAKKMPRKLVALGASAIAAAYAAGYLETRNADRRLVAMANNALHEPTGLVADTAQASSGSALQAAQSKPRERLQSQEASAAGYHDGSYYGVGVSRRGAVAVAVKVQAGQLTTVSITKSNTPYPVARIEALPDEVVSLQSVQIDRISGATYSSIAFIAAVEDALGQAQTGQVSVSTPPAQLPQPESGFRSRPTRFINQE